MTASAAFDVVAFTEASVLYALMLAEIHHLHPEDIERRRLLVQTVLIGDSAITALSKGADRSVPYWGAQIVNKIPMSAVSRANKMLGPRFVTKYGTKQGILVLSKQIPLGLGIGVGAGANYLIGRTIVATARKVFGPAPAAFAPDPDSDPEPDILEPVDSRMRTGRREAPPTIRGRRTNAERLLAYLVVAISTSAAISSSVDPPAQSMSESKTAIRPRARVQ